MVGNVFYSHHVCFLLGLDLLLHVRDVQKTLHEDVILAIIKGVGAGTLPLPALPDSLALVAQGDQKVFVTLVPPKVILLPGHPRTNPANI